MKGLSDKFSSFGFDDVDSESDESLGDLEDEAEEIHKLDTEVKDFTFEKGRKNSNRFRTCKLDENNQPLLPVVVLNCSSQLKTAALLASGKGSVVYKSGKDQVARVSQLRDEKAEMKFARDVRVRYKLRCRGLDDSLLDAFYCEDKKGNRYGVTLAPLRSGGDSLNTLLRLECEEDGRAFVSQVIAAVKTFLSRFHAMGMAHRDIAFSNVLVSQDGAGRWLFHVTDFDDVCDLEVPGECSERVFPGQREADLEALQFLEDDLKEIADYIYSKVDTPPDLFQEIVEKLEQARARNSRAARCAKRS